MLENGVKAPKESSVKTYFSNMFMLMSIIALTAIAFVVFYNVIKWIKRQWRLRLRRERNALIRREAIILRRLARARTRAYMEFFV